MPRRNMSVLCREKKPWAKMIIMVLMSFMLTMVLSGCVARPRDELQSRKLSPDGNYSLNVYMNNGGATVDYSVTVSITDQMNKKEWNIYFRYHLHELPDHYWITNDTVYVDGHRLNIFKDYLEVFDR